MKKAYETLSVDVVKFEAQDVIASSAAADEELLDTSNQRPER